MPEATNRFAARTSIEQVEESAELAPKFDADDLITCVTTDASCHVGYRSCFYRAVDVPGGALRFVETTKTFDPDSVYGDAPNPTQL